MKLVFASNNAHKLCEVRAMMPAGVEVLGLKDIGFEAEIEETGKTLEENSLIKARTVWEWIGEGRKSKVECIDGVFADDTGLEIDALDGEPGVYTARWYKMDRDHYIDETQTAPLPEKYVFRANRQKALRELAYKADRGCQFRTVITLIRGGEIKQVEGVVRGEIAEQEFGEGGFGYDSVFIPEGYDKTFGELSPEVKNSISHRGRAIQALVRMMRMVE